MPPSPVTLMLLRHADAETKRTGQQDQDRPLSARGRLEAIQVAEEMLYQNLIPSCIYCSPARRTRETFAVIRAQLAIKTPEILDPQLYLADIPILSALVSSIPDTSFSAMIIGHNPAIAGLAIHLARQDPSNMQSRLAMGFPTGALTVIRGENWAALSQGAGTLVHYWTPVPL